jgi:phasin protein
MLSMFEQLTSIGKTNLDATLKFASDTAQMTERLARCQVDAATEMLNSNNEQLQMMGSKPGSAASFAYWQSAYQANSEKVLESTRRYFAEVTKIQAEMAHLTKEQVTAMHKNAIKNFEDLAKAATEKTEKAVKATENRAKAKQSP